jgi:hypothetical protein
VVNPEPIGMTRFSILSPRARLSIPVRLSLTFGSVLAVGCGKPATMEDCQRIVVRMAELELQANHVSDPAQVEQQVAATKKSFRERAMKECVGRHLPASAMDCIDKATSTDQILSECLD